MTILLCLTESDINDLPTTQTEMYERSIEITIKRSLQKSGISIRGIDSLSKLPDEHSQVYKELAQFAFDALKYDQLVFTLDELKKICPNLTKDSKYWNGLGLLNSVRRFDGKACVTYHFLHFSIQEYMTAYHISTLPKKNKLNSSKTHFGQFVITILGSCMLA